FSTIYKYRNFTDNNHKNVLLKNELYLSSPNSFNDPFDCKIPPNLKLLDTEEKRWKYAERISNREIENKAESDSSKEKLIQKYCRRLRDNLESEQKLINEI